MKKKRYTKKQLLRWYSNEIERILDERLEQYKYKLAFEIHSKHLDKLYKNDMFTHIGMFGLVASRLCLNKEVGAMFGNSFVINSRIKNIKMKIYKLEKKDGKERNTNKD